jgi:hypothetical protein
LHLPLQDLYAKKKNPPCQAIQGVLQTALTISNVVHDSGRVRAELQKFQRAEYDKIKAITSHSPTRWGAIFFIVQDLIKTKVRCINKL